MAVENGEPGSEQTRPQDGALSSILEDLMTRARTLLSELEAFRARTRDLRQEGNVELGHFRGTIQSELNMLQRLHDKPDDEASKHIARSSNLPFLERLWSIVKRSRDVIALQKRIYTSPGVKSISQGMRHVGFDEKNARDRGPKEGAVVVDAITDGGRTWTKLSLVTNQRLLFDLAKQGWDSGGSDEEEAEDEGLPRKDDDDDRDVPLVKTAKELTRAAKCFRIRTKAPQVRLILPRIRPGETNEIDQILSDCRATGAELFCGDEDLPATPPIVEALSTMAADPLESFSDVLNIDCTILLALVSEFSHAKVFKEPWFHKALRRQVEIEDNENLLPSLLYPVMANHGLVCTKEAVKRMREIVSTIGTPSEKARTAILMEDESDKTQAQLIQEMQEWSAYPVPSNWRLPIRVVDQNEDDCQSNLPPEADQVGQGLTAINRSVFLYGWAAACTTITSNRTVVKQIESGLEQFEDLDDDAFPRIWLCPTARSLVGKEKRGAKKSHERSKQDVWPLPDPLRREQQRRNGLDVLSKREGREVEDLRPNGYPCHEVLEAKNTSQR